MDTSIYGPKTGYPVNRTLILYEQPAIDILELKKTWEMRKNGAPTGWTGITIAGTKMIQGQALIKNVFGPLDETMMKENIDKHQIPEAEIKHWLNRFAYQLEQVIKYDSPIPYNHPQGAQQFVKLDIYQPGLF